MIRPLFVLLTGLVSGEMICAMVTARWVLVLILLMGIALVLIGIVRKSVVLPYVLCVSLGFLLGVLLFLLASRKDGYGEVLYRDLQSGTLFGVVLELKEKKEEEKYTVTIGKAIFFQDKMKITLHKKVQVYMKKDLENPIYPGDIVQCTGELSLPEEPTNPGEFNQKVSCRAKGVYYIFFGDCYQIKNRPVHSVKRIAYQMKEKMEDVYSIVFLEDQAALLYAIVLGDKTSLSDEIKKIYEENGVAHLLAVSGLHVSIVGGQIYQFLRKKRCSYVVSCLGGMIVLLFYGCMTGFGSSVTRAVFMFGIYLGAEWFGTYYDILSSMSLAGILMLMEHPYRILEGGFLISYTSIFAIGMVLPIVQEILKRKETKRREDDGVFPIQGWKKKWKESVTSSAVIYAVTLPMIMRFYFEATPYCILLNPLILPFMAILMISGILVGFSGLVCQLFFMPILNNIFVKVILSLIAFPASIILESYEQVFLFVRKLPASLLITGCPSIEMLIIIYLLETLLLFLLYRESYQNAGILCGVVVFFFFIRPPGPFQITMLDVGQGDCILIQTPEDKNILIDGGSSSKKEIFKYIIKPALYYYGITKLDVIVVSHKDEDHISGIRELLESGYQVSLMLTNNGTFEGKKMYPSLKRMEKIQKGNLVTIGKLQLECLHPRKDFLSEEENAKSVVLYLQYEKFRALFMGDLGLEQEPEILGRAEDVPLTLLKVGHHGSKYSTGEELLKVYRPQYAFLSAGENNRYGHPHKEVLQRLKKIGAKIWQTKEGGAICFINYKKNKVRYFK